MVGYLLLYNLTDKTLYLNEKQKAHVVEFIWSCLLPLFSLKVLKDIYYDNSLLEKGHTGLSDLLLEFYLAGTIVDFYLCYKDYYSYFTKITITHHILWISFGLTALYNNASIYASFVYFIEIPCIVKCFNKFFPTLKNTLLFAKTWIIFRIFYFIPITFFLVKQFKINFPILNNFNIVWWSASLMHIWWGIKLIIKNEKETYLFKMIRKPYLLNNEHRPQLRGFIHYILYNYKIIHCIMILYFYNVFNYDYYYLYILNGCAVFFNVYVSYKMHCNDLLEFIGLKYEAYYWKLDELSINCLIFFRYLLLSNLISFPYYFNIIGYTIFLSNCYHIYIKNNLIKYDFNNGNSFPNHYKLSHILFFSLFIFSGMYCYYVIPKTMYPSIGWCVYAIAFLIYYSKFCYEINNKYIRQHDIAHLILVCNFMYFLITDVI